MTDSIDNLNFIFLKLVNGDNLMCSTKTPIDGIEKQKQLTVLDPIQIFSFKLPVNGAIIEKYILQAWTPFSTANKAVIPMNTVVFVGQLKDYFIEKYMEYITDPNAQQILEEGSVEETGDEELQEEVEMMEEEQEDFNFPEDETTKKWYH